MLHDVDGMLMECTSMHNAQKLEDVLVWARAQNDGWDVVPYMNAFTSEAPADLPWIEPSPPTVDELARHGAIYVLLRLSAHRVGVFQALDRCENDSVLGVGDGVMFQAENGVDLGTVLGVVPAAELRRGVPLAPFTRVLRRAHRVELERLRVKRADEAAVLQIVRALAPSLRVRRVEFQFDYRRLVLFAYETQYVDYVKLVHGVRVRCQRRFGVKPRVYVQRKRAVSA